MKQSEFAGKNLLLVNTGTHKKRFILKKLRKLGMNIICLNKEMNWGQPYVDHWIIADNSNHSEALQAVDKFLSTNSKVKKFDGVVTFWEDDVLLTSKIVDKYNLIGIPYRIASQVRNKFKFREFCQANGLPFPKHHIVRSEDDIKYVLDNFKLPVVLKPAFGSSSAYVIRADAKEDLLKSYEYIKSNISAKTETALNEGFDIFVEEYIDGDEVDIDLIVQNGKVKFHSITDNFDKTMKGIFFLDRAEALPSALPEKNKVELEKMAEVTLEKLGIQNAIIHYEAKLTSKGPYPIEVNMRMGGDNVYSQLKAVWGIDYIEYAVRIALDMYFEIPDNIQPKKYTIAWILHPEDSGLLTEIDIDEEELEKDRHFEAIDIYKEIGDPILVPPEGFEIIGWVMVSGENPLDMQDNLKKILEKVEFNVVRYDDDSYVGKTVRKDRFSSAILNKQILLKEARLAKIQKVAKSDLKSLKIGIIGNINRHSSNPIDLQLSSSCQDVYGTLKTQGYNAKLFPIVDISTTINDIKSSDIELVINLAKKVDNLTVNESRVTSFLDTLGIPYTGSDNYPLTVSSDKITFKKLLEFHDIPTPAWDYVFSIDGDVDDELEYPLIVKPADKNNSIGISNESVVTNERELRIQIEKIIKEMRSPVLIEEYIEGDEFSVMILGNEDDDIQILPLSRTNFDKLPKNFWHIYSYDLKWHKDKLLENKIIVQNPPTNVSQKLQKLMTEIALDTYNIIRCKDYGQVEIKTDKDGNPYVLELNTNPFLGLGSPIVKSVSTLKYGHIGLLEEVMLTAIRRYKLKLDL